jgi:hypothetical protein
MNLTSVQIFDSFFLLLIISILLILLWLAITEQNTCRLSCMQSKKTISIILLEMNEQANSKEYMIVETYIDE